MKTDALDQLHAGVERLTHSEEWTRWLDAQHRFHDYSCARDWSRPLRGGQPN